MAMIDRAGTQAVSPEQVVRRYHDERHPQSGKFIRKGTVPVKAPRPRAKRKRTLPIRED